METKFFILPTPGCKLMKFHRLKGPGKISQIKMLNPKLFKNKSYYMNF